MTEILMSIKPQYVEKILRGEKTVEVRSRKLKINFGARVWIYSTLPKGCIEVTATVKCIEYADPKKVWELYATKIGITKSEFDNYVHNKIKVSAIELTNITKIKQPITLNSIKSCIEDFQPPQFFSHIKSGMKISDFLINNESLFRQSIILSYLSL